MSSRIPASIAALSLLALCSGAVVAACSSSSSPASVPDAGAGDTGGGVDAGADAPVEAAADAADGGADGAVGAGSATIAGNVGGTPFTNAVSAFWIGAPDLAATTAVYVVGTPGVACRDIAASGWSHTIPAGVQIFEMIMTTQTPAEGTYAVSTATNPPAGSAEVNYIFSAPARNETRANAGSIALTTLTAGVSAVGTFSVQFPGAADAAVSSLDGTFTAVYCAGGHEP